MAIQLSPPPLSSTIAGFDYLTRGWSSWFTSIYDYVTNQRATVTISSATTLSPVTYGDREILVDSAAGIAITLPTATGSGQRYNLNIVTTITSLTTTVVTTSPDKLVGTVYQTKTDNTFLTYIFNGTGHTTLTLNGTTKGGLVGDRIQLTDIKANVWQCLVYEHASGAVASPVS